MSLIGGATVFVPTKSNLPCRETSISRSETFYLVQCYRKLNRLIIRTVYFEFGLEVWSYRGEAKLSSN